MALKNLSYNLLRTVYYCYSVTADHTDAAAASKWLANHWDNRWNGFRHAEPTLDKLPYVIPRWTDLWLNCHFTSFFPSCFLCFLPSASGIVQSLECVSVRVLLWAPGFFSLIGKEALLLGPNAYLSVNAAVIWLPRTYSNLKSNAPPTLQLNQLRLWHALLSQSYKAPYVLGSLKFLPLRKVLENETPWVFACIVFILSDAHNAIFPLMFASTKWAEDVLSRIIPADVPRQTHHQLISSPKKQFHSFTCTLHRD